MLLTYLNIPFYTWTTKTIKALVYMKNDGQFSNLASLQTVYLGIQHAGTNQQTYIYGVNRQSLHWDTVIQFHSF